MLTSVFEIELIARQRIAERTGRVRNATRRASR